MKSIKAKLSFGIIGITFLFVGLTWFLNFNVMVKYYVAKNKSILLKSAEEIDEVEDDKLEEYIRYQERAKGMFIALYSEKMEKIFVDSFHPTPKLGDGMKGMPPKNEEFRHFPGFGPEFKNGKKDINKTEKSKKEDRMRPIPPEVYIKENIIKLKNKKYIFNDKMDEFKKVHFLNLIYKKKGGGYIFIIKPAEAIAESAGIAAKFSLFSGIITIIIGIIYAVLFSSKFTKPILLINKSARKIAKLEFDEECRVESNDEIGELGKSINIMSKKLSEVIGELQKSNLRLEKEIEYERNMEKLRKEFVSSVSHELRTPISLIRGYAEGLKYSVIEKEEDKEFYCDVIVDESQKMTKLISDLLNLAQIESGTYKIEKKNINLSELTKVIVEKYSIFFKEKNINIKTDIEDEIWINADSIRIEQVISNFINNGVNHIEGDRVIEVKLYKTGELARVGIFNTGKNIKEELSERVWESFYKVDKARSREYGGVGLGLSIVSGIMKLHEAGYGFENKNNGVEFWFEIKLK